MYSFVSVLFSSLILCIHHARIPSITSIALLTLTPHSIVPLLYTYHIYFPRLVQPLCFVILYRCPICCSSPNVAYFPPEVSYLPRFLAYGAHLPRNAEDVCAVNGKNLHHFLISFASTAASQQYRNWTGVCRNVPAQQTPPWWRAFLIHGDFVKYVLQPCGNGAGKNLHVRALSLFFTSRILQHDIYKISSCIARWRTSVLRYGLTALTYASTRQKLSGKLTGYAFTLPQRLSLNLIEHK